MKFVHRYILINFISEYKILRAQRRSAEKKWIKSGSQADHESYKYIRDKCNDISNAKKKEFFAKKFTRYSHSQKSLYKFVETFLDQEKCLALPSDLSLPETVNEFNKFFTEKIDKIRDSFPGKDACHANPISFSGSLLSEFRPATISEIVSVLDEFGVKTSSIDPLPSELITEHLDLFLPMLCEIVNLSLSSGSIDGIKLAHLTPLIKGDTLNNELLKNYRPISNLPFVGKLIERIVKSRLDEHLSSNNLNIKEQSGYKKNHSTETVLMIYLLPVTRIQPQ